jgi:hypothetical protein
MLRFGLRNTVQFVAFAALALIFGLLPADASGPGRPPCASCITVVLGLADQIDIQESLNGLEVVIEVPPGREQDAAPFLEQIRLHGGRPGLLIAGLPVASPSSTGSTIDTLIIDTRSEPGSIPDLTFGVKSRLAEVRGTLPAVRLGIAVRAAPEIAAMRRELSPYVDFVVIDGPRSPANDLPVWYDGGRVDGAAGALEQSQRTDADRVMVRLAGERAAETLGDLARAIPFLTPQLISTSETFVACAGRRAAVWQDVSTGDHIAWNPACRDADAIDVPAGSAIVARSRLSVDGVLIRLSNSSGQRFAEDLQVAAPRKLTVEEIVARHQAAAARQAARVRTLISSGTMTLTFEAPGFPAPVVVTADSTFYNGEGRSEIAQRAIRVNGIRFKGSGMPRLPIIEPERVSAPPLAITLTDAYRYALRGTQAVDGTQCYVVAFEPTARAGSFFEGEAWIDVTSYGLVRVVARQTGLRGSIVASEQVDEFRREADDLWLLSRSHVRQLYEGAAHRTPIDRVFVVERHEIDPPNYTERRAATYASDDVILRDTPQGYRYLGQADSRSGRADVERGDSRDVSGRSSRVRTIVLGTILDPNISHPLPFAGLSYVDFDLLGTGAQFDGFFGGTYGQLAVSVPSIAGTRWQLGGRAFAILTSYNDRSFVDGIERYAENISQRPAHGSVWIVRPLSPRVSVRAGYELDFTRYTANDMTSAAFTVPADQLVHGFRATVDAQSHGWRASAWWNPAMRTGWRPWGMAGEAEYHDTDRDFQRAGASLARLAVVSPELTIRGEATVMAGHDLDRFSRFAFGAFDNRLRGFPAALIRYDRGAVFRGSAAWALGSRMRLDGFLDTAFVHDPGLANGLTRLTGVGAALEAPAPFGTLIAAEWGYGLEGRRSDGRRGTHVIRITGYKVF